MQSKYARPLTARFLFREALGTFRRRFWRIFAVGAIAALVASLLDEILDLILEHWEGGFPVVLGTVAILLAALTTGANSFGATFLSGLLDKTVGEDQHGHPRLTLRAIFLTLPYLTLIWADILVTVLRGVGVLFFIIPGIALLTLSSVVGPIVIIEQRKAVSAIKRSFGLVWPFFWLTFRAVTLPLLIESQVDEAVAHIPFLHGFAPHLAVSTLLEVPMALFVSLVEVTLAYHLIERSTPGTVTEHH